MGSASEARESDLAFQTRSRETILQEQTILMRRVCQEIDQDGNGQITVEELFHAYQTNHTFKQVFKLLNLHINDVQGLLSVADKNGDGRVDYEEFIDLIIKLK